MLTSFQKKRLEYFIKASLKGEYIQLGKGDIEIFTKIQELNSKQEQELDAELRQHQIKIDN